MALDFPNTPAVNDVYTYNNYSWQWTGKGWQAISGPGSKGITVINTATGLQVNRNLFIGTTTPTGMSTGDVWIAG